MSVAAQTKKRLELKCYTRREAEAKKVAFELSRRIDAMMLRVANTPIPEGQEALDLFGSLASDLRDIARGSAV